MAVSRRLRYEILRRDNHACRYCGRSAPDVPLTVDHVVPTTLGGNDDPSNLTAACKDCNSGKSATPPDAPLVGAVRADAESWANAITVAAAQLAQRDAERDERIAMFETVWSRYWLDDDSQNDTSSPHRHPGRRYAPRPADWRTTVIRFVAAGLDHHFLSTAVRTAMYATQVPFDDVWRYFCGICWRRLDEVRELAAQSVASEEARATAGDPR